MDDDSSGTLSRRDFLKGAGAVAGASTLAGSVGRGIGLDDGGLDLEELTYPLRFLSRVEWRNLAMLENGLDYVADATWDDLEYNEQHFRQKIGTLISGLVEGEGMNDFQKYSAAEGYVSSPEDGIGAGVTDNGRLSSLFFPHTGFTTHLPYFAHGSGELDGSKPQEGSFAGIRLDDEVSWLWEDEVISGEPFSYREDAGMLDVGYAYDDLSIDETTYVLPGEEALVREYDIENVGEEPVDGSFLYYTQANVTDSQQNFILWSSNRNRITADDELRWEDLEGPYDLHVGMDAEVTDSWISAPFTVVLDELVDGPLDDGAELVTDTAADLAGLDDAVVEVDADVMEGIYLGGTLETDLDLEPGESETVSVYLAGGEEPSLPAPGAGGQDETEGYWDSFTEDIDVPEGATDTEARRYERAVRTLGMMFDRESGSIPAAPNLQPMYYPSWIRDASFVSVAMAQAGKEDIAKEYLGGFLSEVQENDGSFKQCYDSSGGSAGIFEVENDQQPIYVWAVNEVYEQTGDERFLEQAWPAVEDALEYTMDAVVDNGLLAATPDYAEMPTNIRQSLFANTFAYRALQDGAAMAEVVGEDGDRFRAAAREIGDATYREFFEGADEFYTVYTISGGTKDDLSSIDSPAIWPTGWAGDYGVRDELIGEFMEETEEYKNGWVPGHLTKAAMLYAEGEEEIADTFVEDVLPHMNEAGDLVEEVNPDGEYRFASPLGWSQAAYLLAMDEKY